MQPVGRMALATGRLASRRTAPSVSMPKVTPWHSMLRAASGQAQSKVGPGLVDMRGSPVRSKTPGDDGLGQEVDMNAQNFQQVLASPSALLLQVGVPSEGIMKKVNQLRAAAQGRLPLVRFDPVQLPQVAQALQIQSSPAFLLLARGQVATALEGDLSPQTATTFVETVAKMLGLQVDLAANITEQLAEAEEQEWSDAVAADTLFLRISEQADLPMDARVRAAAGRARCALRGNREEEARAIISELEKADRQGAEVKQATAMMRLHLMVGRGGKIEELRLAASAAPGDVSVVQPCTVALFWAGHPGEALDVGLKLLRRKRSDASRELVLSLLEALGPRHPRSASARKSFNSALFV